MPNLGADKEANGSSETTRTSDGSFQLTDSDSDQSWHSPLGSMDGIISVHCDDDEQPLRLMDKQRGSDEEIDLERGELEMKEERDCRICHLSLLKSEGIRITSGGDQVQEEASSGGMMAIELGCSCKGDLAATHKQCAETWFKTKGNTVCEICGTNALNIAGELTNEANNATVATLAASAAPVVALPETRGFWHGRRVMNFLLASMVFAFVISWLFHFNILP